MGVRGRCEENGQRCRAVLICRATHCHRNSRIVVLEPWEVIPPKFPWSKMAVVELVGKVQVYPLDILGEYGRTGPETDR